MASMCCIKNPQRQWQGAANRKIGSEFEAAIEQSLGYYAAQGLAVIEKNSEPMRVIKSLGKGQFVACFKEKAQPDYKGTLKGGRSVVFEAKFTTKDKMEQSRVSPVQADQLTLHHQLGALCFVVIGFAGGGIYRIPWPIWADMKAIFGRKYVRPEDVIDYRVPVTGGGLSLIFHNIKHENGGNEQ